MHVHTHGFITRVFRLAVIKMMILLTKDKAFGPFRCHMYTIECYNIVLFHDQMLICLIENVNSNRIDNIYIYHTEESEKMVDFKQ